MIQKTSWRPDTCGCHIIYQWDDSDIQTVTLDSMPHKCEFHENLSDQDAYNAVRTENVTKNQVLGHVLENHPSLVEDDGKGNKELKDGIEYDWSFDANRKLNVDFKGADKPSAEAIKDGLDQLFGVDVVNVNIP